MCSRPSPQPPTLFSLVSPGSQMGAQNTSTQPSLRLSPCCLLLPGHCDPGAELCEEPLVRSSSCCCISMEKTAPLEWGEKAHLLSSVKSNPGVLLLHGWISSASSRFIPGFVIKMRNAAAWPNPSVSLVVKCHRLPFSAPWRCFLSPVSSPGDRAVYTAWIICNSRIF